MEKVLKLYKYIDGSNDTPFPNVEYQAVVSDFRYDVKRMGGAPIITCTVMHTLCLDKLWSENVYAYFNGERFFIKQIPTSSYNNTDSRYKHELELVSERIVLDNVYFYDVVDSSENNDKPVSNSSNFSFFGDINEFASRLNQSLQYSNVDYSVVVDDGISSEAKMVSFQDQFFSGAIQEGYNTYNVPFYFEGKVIHFGYTNNAITRTFKYGDKESLLSIQKQNANYKVVNRVTGVGSEDNIPYYYPNDYESKEEVEANGGTWINPQTNLMPSIYRESLGKERFYEALNNAYQIPGSDEYYEFENPYIEGKPKEHIVNFDYIKPTIKGITNSEGLRIDMFKEFAYDANDNDEVDEEGNYLHPYFFAKLRKFDGEHGFNLFDHAIDEQEMVISMTSGSCGACEFAIGVDETTQKNPVQVDDEGNLKRDKDGNVIVSGTPQDAQNNTQENEVWIALKKDIDTFGVIMPNASKNYRPSTNDTFVILHIDLPKAYILAAEDKLKEELIKYMSLNNSEKFNFSISFSRIFFAENPKILEQLNENARIQIEYDNTTYELYISSYSYSMSKDAPLPEIRIELSDTLTISQNALQTAIGDVKNEILSSIGGSANIDILKQGLRYFLRKDKDDRSKGKISSDKAIEVGTYVSGASGAIIYKDTETGQTVGELDKLYVRMKAYFETLEIINVNTVGGKQIISPAGSVRCIGVEETENEYLCYFLAEQDGEKVENRWKVGDQAYSHIFNAKDGVSNNISNKYYWRLVTSVSSDSVAFEGNQCHYIALSKTDCDSYSDIPSIGDVINHRGSRTDLDRMNFIEMSSVDAFSPNITLFHGVNSYSLDGKAYVSYGVDKSTNKAFMNVYGDMYVGDRKGGSYMRYTQENGLEISGTLSVGTKLGDTPLKDLISASSPEGYQEFVEKITQDIEGLQSQIDGAIESYFYQYDPTLGNYPASVWVSNGTEKAHLNDTFTNLVSGRSWRWSLDGTTYKWVEITDTAAAEALRIAGEAADTADGKRRVFVETPYPPYDNGDLWSGGSDTFLKICINTRETGVYDPDDWDYADKTAKIEENIATFDYLKEAMKEDTTIEGGLIQSSTLTLGYTDVVGQFNVMSGTNGIFNQQSHGGGVASWWGGGLHDLLDYYTWDGNTWKPKANVTIPTNIPSGLIRMDGTGYLAKGKFWWDNEGKLYADPTALFLMFDVENESKSLSSTILALRDKQTEFESMWSVKTDASGKKYLYSTFDLVTQGGVSMYAGTEGLNLPSIYNGLPIDGSTIYWENGILKAKGSSGDGGGLDITALQNYLTQNSYLNVTSGDNRYLKLSGGTINGAWALDIKRSDGYYASLITFSNTSGILGYVGFTPDKRLAVWSDLNLSEYTIWHSGNDGSGSGLDADMLDGYHVTHFMSYIKGSGYVQANLLNSELWNVAGGDGYIEYYDNGTWFNSRWGKVLAHYGFDGDLRGNASSATKLQTARTIWGRSFDGTSDISGSLYITNNNAIYIKDTSDNWLNQIEVSSGNAFNIGYSSGGRGYSTLLYGGDITLKVGISRVTSLYIDSNRNGEYNGMFTFKRASQVPLYISNTDSSLTDVCARFVVNNAYKASIGTNSGDYLLRYNADLSKSYVIWDSGNDGHNSGLDADTLDGYHSSAFMNFTATGGYVGASMGNETLSKQASGNGYIEFWDGAGGWFNFRCGYVKSSSSMYIASSLFLGDGGEGIYIHGTGVSWHNSSNTWTRSIMYINSNGDVCIGNQQPSARLHVLGDILTTGGITMYSMRALKNVVDERGLSLTELSVIKPTRYTWKDGRDNKLHFGGIADDIQQVLPEVVYSTSDGILTMDYGNAAFAVASSLIQPVVDHEKRIAMLEKENKELRNELERLKAS